MAPRRGSVYGATPKVSSSPLLFPLPIYHSLLTEFPRPTPLPTPFPTLIPQNSQLKRRIEIRKIFDSIDNDGSGTVTIEELDEGA